MRGREAGPGPIGNSMEIYRSLALKTGHFSCARPPSRQTPPPPALFLLRLATTQEMRYTRLSVSLLYTYSQLYYAPLVTRVRSVRAVRVALHAVKGVTYWNRKRLLTARGAFETE